MEQSELNGIAQRWLEGLVQLQKTNNQKSQMGPLAPKGLQDLNTVLETLASGMKITLPVKTSLHAGGTHLAVLARTLSSYLSVALDVRDVDSIAGTVHAHVAQALISLLGLEEPDQEPKASIYHDDVRDGFTRVFQMALYKKYDKMGTEGLLATANKPPVVYVGSRGEVTLLYHICAKDVDVLEKQINDDCNQGRTPTLVVSYAGTPLAGHIEDFQSLRRICNRYNIWLHITGHGLSSLCLPEERSELQGVSTADSLTLFPGSWFGILSCPMITIHKHPQIIQTNGVPTSVNYPGETELEEGKFPIPSLFWTGLYPHGLPKLLPLSLWVCLQYLGTSALMDTVSYCRGLTKNMIGYLDRIPGVTRLYVPNHTSHIVLFKYSGGGQLTLPASLKQYVLQQPQEGDNQQPLSEQTPPIENGDSAHTPPPATEPNPGTDNQMTSTNDESSSRATPPLANDSSSTDSNNASPQVTTPPDPPTPDDTNEPVTVTIHGMPPAITNMYNLMLSSELKAHFPKLGLGTYDMGEKDGVVFRFDPTVSFPEHSTSIEDIEKFATDLKAKLTVLHPIAQARCLFEVALRSCPNLRWMEFPNIHCVAVMQFVPSDWITKQELSLEEVNELNSLNVDFCNHLVGSVPVFSPFQHGNFTCILIKELAEGKTMFELLETLLSELKKFEEHREHLKNMAEQIQEGIKAAQNDLIKEKTKEEEEEGILKYVPIVGSVVGWLYPTSPTGRTGRSFNLSSGKVEDTAQIYKNKLQLIEEKGIEAVSEEIETPSEPVNPELLPQQPSQVTSATPESTPGGQDEQ